MKLAWALAAALAAAGPALADPTAQDAVAAPQAEAVPKAEAVPQPEVVPQAEAAPQAEPAAAPAQAVLAGSLVTLQVGEMVSSQTAKAGDKFVILLAAPITAGEQVLVPAGTKGVGEVVSAARAGSFGKAGELVVAARYLELDGRKIPLKAFKVSGSGSSSTDQALTTALVASAVVGLPGIILGMPIRGGDKELPVGLVATAKLAADLAAPEAPAEPAPAASAETASISIPAPGETHEPTP